MNSELTLNQEQLECLASPSRNDVYAAMRLLRLASAREVADRIGKSAEAVHYHLKALTAVGLLRVASRRPAPKKPEGVYEAIGDSIRLPGSDAGPEAFRLASKLVEAGMRQAIRARSEAVERAQAELELQSRFKTIRTNVRLSEEELRTFLEMVEAASRFAKEHDSEDGIRLAWSSVIYPVV